MGSLLSKLIYLGCLKNSHVVLISSDVGEEGIHSPSSPYGAVGGGLTGEVMVSKGAKKRCWFRIMPRFKGQGKGDGDKVYLIPPLVYINKIYQIYVDETVCLVHVKSGQFVVSGVASEYGDLTPTIGLSISLAGWKISLFNMTSQGVVRSGDALRLLHEEGGYIARADSTGTLYPTTFVILITIQLTEGVCTCWDKAAMYTLTEQYGK